MKRLLSTVICGLSLAACRAEVWTGTIYRDRTDLARSSTIGTFDSLESCRQACQSALAEWGAAESGDYECGLNCKPKNGILICSRTEN
jgi:hypothetical protein